MFCGNCGTQVPEGASTCPNCGAAMAPKSQAQQMNQALQNAGQNLNAAGTKAKDAVKKLDNKQLGMIGAGIVAVIVVIFILKAIFGGSGLKGTYTNGYTTMTFEGSKITFNMMGVEFTAKYKVKKDKIVLDPKSIAFTQEALDYFEDELDMDEDDIQDELDDLVDDMEDDPSASYKYDKKKKVLTMDGIEYYYAENYKVGPNGTYVSEDDEDVTLTFKNGELTYDNDGDDETLSYYCYDDGHDVYVVFYGLEFEDSEFYHTYYTSRFEFDDDEIEINDITFEKE